MVSSTTRLLSIATRKNGSFIASRLNSSTLRASSSLLGGGGGNLSSTTTSLNVNYAKRWNSNYPAHEVLGMPSLSPVSSIYACRQLNFVIVSSYCAVDNLERSK